MFEEEYPVVADCVSQALLYIFMYIAFNNFVIWIAFLNYLQNGEKLLKANENEESEIEIAENADEIANGQPEVPQEKSLGCEFADVASSVRGLVYQIVTRPPVIASTLGLVVGLIPELQDVVGEGSVFV